MLFDQPFVFQVVLLIVRGASYVSKINMALLFSYRGGEEGWEDYMRYPLTLTAARSLPSLVAFSCTLILIREVVQLQTLH